MIWWVERRPPSLDGPRTDPGPGRYASVDVILGRRFLCLPHWRDIGAILGPDITIRDLISRHVI